MSVAEKVAWLMRWRRRGYVGMRVTAVVAWTATVACAAEIPYAQEAIAVGKAAGGMDAASVWAVVACAMFACMIALGYGIFTIGTKLQTSLAVLAADVKARGNCQTAEVVSSLVNAARTEIEQCGKRMRQE